MWQPIGRRAFVFFLFSCFLPSERANLALFSERYKQLSFFSPSFFFSRQDLLSPPPTAAISLVSGEVSVLKGSWPSFLYGIWRDFP